jgi:hypothetical protein
MSEPAAEWASRKERSKLKTPELGLAKGAGLACQARITKRAVRMAGTVLITALAMGLNTKGLID